MKKLSVSFPLFLGVVVAIVATAVAVDHAKDASMREKMDFLANEIRIIAQAGSVEEAKENFNTGLDMASHRGIAPLYRREVEPIYNDLVIKKIRVMLDHASSRIEKFCGKDPVGNLFAASFLDDIDVYAEDASHTSNLSRYLVDVTKAETKVLRKKCDAMPFTLQRSH